MGCLKPPHLISSIYLEKFMHSLRIHFLYNSEQVMNNVQVICSYSLYLIIQIPTDIKVVHFHEYELVG